jgi:hypothetical protein
VRVEREAVGGGSGRSVWVHAGSCAVDVREAGSRTRRLWEAERAVDVGSSRRFAA